MEGSPLSQYSYGNIETVPRVYVYPLPGAGYIFFLRMAFMRNEQVCNLTLYEKSQYRKMKKNQVNIFLFVNSNACSKA